jgi:sulfite oxidase
VYLVGVYDITKFIENHPGGAEKAQLAAGGQLENYWNLYRQHYNSPTPKRLLGQMCIGQLDPKDVADNRKNRDLSDPYSSDPEVSSVLRTLQSKPVNAEPPGAILGHSWLTPSSVFFVRNHHPVPDIAASAKEYKVEFQIDGEDPISLSLEDIKNKFEKREVVVTLQCGGNRREEMSLIENTAGTPWRIGALSNARWEGAYLSDVLRYLGMKNSKIRRKENDFDDGDCGQDDYDR